MARPRRFSIGWLMVVVGLVAADFAIVRGVWEDRNNDNGWVVIALSTLPMIDILLLAAPKLRPGNSTRPYWLGFQVTGWIEVAVIVLLGLINLDLLMWPVVWLPRLVQSMKETVKLTITISIFVLIATAAPLPLAHLAGKLSARYRLVVERR